MKKVTLLGLLFAVSATRIPAQNCKVLLGSVSLSYVGDCKDDKANGKGKATGQDTYEGDFKAGYPDGSGKYTWKQGDWFDGSWKKGIREGQGEMHYKKEGRPDSVMTGFWKKDVYVGRFEIPYKVINQSSKISTVKVTRNNGYKEHDITFTIESTSGGTSSTGVRDASFSDIPKMKLTGVDVQKGNFDKQTNFDNLARTSKSILKTVEFPFKATFRIDDSQAVEIEFFEEGNYLVEVRILN
jgi:hypothetical protein